MAERDTRWSIGDMLAVGLSIASVGVFVDVMAGSPVSDWARDMVSGAIHWRCRHELDQATAKAYEDGWRKGYNADHTSSHEG